MQTTMKWNSTLYDKSHDFVSKYGAGLLPYLNPKLEETILDLGCGTGDLTHEISLSGAKVIGVDSSAEMIKTAKSKFPEIEFHQTDAKELKFETPFDAIFSNAVLHWIPEKEKVIERMYSQLKEGGRIVVEFGGKGNNEKMLKTLRDVFTKRGYSDNAKVDFWYYPSIGEYAMELEKANFRVIHAEHFDRITPLKGEQGIRNWFQMFGDYLFAGISESVKESVLNEVQNELEKTHLINGVWHADYKRIRVIATK